MPNLIEDLRNIKKDRRIVFICFYIIYSFDNSVYQFYDCVFTSETKLMIGN